VLPELHRLVTLLLPAAVVSGACAGPAWADERAAKDFSPLDQHVQEFFRAHDPDVRARLAAVVEESAGGDFDVVAGAMERVRLWTTLPHQQGVLSFDSAAGASLAISYSLPDRYDPGERYPLLLCMPDEAASADETLALAKAILPPETKGFVLVCPEQVVGGTFEREATATEDLRSLLRSLRQQIHIDSDRVCLFGANRGGDAAWMATIGHSDLLAGAIVISGYLRVPYPEQLYPLLLENIRNVPVLTTWVPDEVAQVGPRRKAVRSHNRGIVRFAERASLPIKSVELARDTPFELPKQEAADILGYVRKPPSRQVSHTFWHPAQGETDWLRAAKYDGEVWQGEQLSILVSPHADRDTFIRGVLEDKLAYLHGRIEGQAITIESRRCARIDLLLPCGIVDWSQPIRVTCNGRNRYEGLVQPSIKTLLDTAYDQWEFQRLVAVRLSISVGAQPGRR